MGSIDLSVEAIVLLVGASTVSILNNFELGYSVLAAAAVLGGILGAINGLIYAYDRIPSFIVLRKSGLAQTDYGPGTYRERLFHPPARASTSGTLPRAIAALSANAPLRCRRNETSEDGGLVASTENTSPSARGDAAGGCRHRTAR